MKIILMILIIVLSNLDAQTMRIRWFHRYGPKLANVKCSCCSHNTGKHKNHYYKDYYKPNWKDFIPKITIPKIELPKFEKFNFVPSVSFEPYNYAQVLDNPTQHFKLTNKNK